MCKLTTVQEFTRRPQKREAIAYFGKQPKGVSLDMISKAYSDPTHKKVALLDLQIDVKNPKECCVVLYCVLVGFPVCKTGNELYKNVKNFF